MNAHSTSRWPILLPLISGLIASFVIRWFDVDRRISSQFYDADLRAWPLLNANPWAALYRYGTYPPVCLGMAGLLVWAIGWRFWPKLDTARAKVLCRRSLFLGLMLLIGPGFLVNSAIKSAWGRPRPVQCREFGGEFAFRAVGDWEPQTFVNNAWPSAPPVIAFFLLGPVLSSFPSGHASIAFYLMSPAFLMEPKRWRLRAFWMCFGITYGVAMGVSRVLQGGHFPSDILWAGMIVYLVGAILDRMISLHECNQPNDPIDDLPSQQSSIKSTHVPESKVYSARNGRSIRDRVASATDRFS